MKTVRELTAFICSEHELAAALLKARRYEKLDKIAEKYCPVRIGDVVECNSYVHHGKKMIAEKIRVDLGTYSSGFIITGPIVKKDGTPSAAQEGRYVVPTEHMNLAIDDLLMG